MYYSKEECYSDCIVSLSLGIIDEIDIGGLIEYYECGEHYECCQGIIEAYKDYKNGNNR
jgi:hypothetical protein